MSDHPKKPAADARPAPASGARQKALKHLRNLIVAGAATQLGAACECGPVVCDPLPPPLECNNNPNTSQYRSSLSESADLVSPGRLRVHLQVVDNVGKLSFTGDPAVARATLAGPVTRTASDLSFELLVDANAQDVELVVPIGCAGVDDSLKYRLVLADRRFESLE